MGFKDQFNLKERIDESRRVLRKHPERVPIICEKSDKCKLNIDKSKYLVPLGLTVGQFIYVVRKSLKLEPEKAIFLFVNGKIPPSILRISELYYNEKSDDGFLYVTYCDENVFG